MNGTSSSLQISFSVDAVSSAIWRDSTTHGPAIRNKGLSRPASNPQSFMLSSRDRGLGLAGLVLQSGLDERREERMPAAGRRGEYGMELAADEPRVRRQRDHRVRRVAVEFRAVRAREADDVSRELDHCELHAQADAQIRDLVLARVLDRLHHAFHAALAETARNEYRVHAFQERADAVLF